MDGANVNGGNTRIAPEDPNLESADGGDSAVQSIAETRNSPSSCKTPSTIGSNPDTQGINGDLKATSKKPGMPSVRRRTRKSITEGNMTESIGTRTRKRKQSNFSYASSDDSEEEFNGFELHGLDLQPGGHVLKKLIAEAEIAEAQFVKRIRYSRSLDEKKEDNPDFDHTRAYVYETDSFGQFDMEKIKREKESDKSETDSIDMPNSIDSEIEPSKIESVSVKSANSSATSSPSAASQRSRSSRISRGPSPGGRSKVVDMSNPLYKEPFKHGWKRELVFRATNDNALKRMADIYYYTPTGKKVRSFREVAECLNSKELKIDHFTFFKEPIGLDDPEKEIVRDAKKMRGSVGIYGKKSPVRKFTPVKKSAQESVAKKIERQEIPVTKKPVQESQVPVAVITPSPAPAETSKPSSVPVSVPTRATKSTKVTTTPVHKPKAAAKKTPQIKMKSPAEEIEMLPPQRNTANTRRNQQSAEKVAPVKTKRSLPKKQSQEVEQQQQQQHNFMVSICAGYNALLRIFQYLKVQELLRAARVCKMWRDLAAHPSLWKTVRMKNSQVTDWEGLADTLQRRGTQYLDLRKMLVAGESDLWKKFLTVIPRVTSLVKLELCKCPVMVVEEVIKNCPQLEVLSAMSIKCDSLNLESVGNLKQCQELRLKAISGMSLQQDLTPLQELMQLTQLSLTSVRELGKKKIDIIQALTNLETLELGECSDFPDKFGTNVLIKLNKLERLRLEKGQGSCCTFDILEGVSKLENLSQMELVNFDVKNGFDKCLANCKNIKRLLIIPTYISQSATSNNMVLGGVTELSNNLTHFVWGVTLELLRVTELFVDQCNLTNKQVNGDSIPVLKPVPCLNLVKNTEEETENQKGDNKTQQPHLTSPQVDILPLPQLQKLLLTALPKTRVKILKIPFHATWRQSISDTAT